MKTIIIEDEPLATVELQNMLAMYTNINVVAFCDNGKNAIHEIKMLSPELIFLDINLPDMNGFEVLESLDYSPHVVFITAYDEYAIKAFSVNALDYLLKPVGSERLAAAVAKTAKLSHLTVKEQRLSLSKRIFIKDGEKCYFVPLSEIYLIESVGNYVRIYCEDKKPMLHKSLNYLEDRLPIDFFFRTDRRHIVNVNYIKNILPYFNSTLQVELIDGTKLHVSQRQSVKFKEVMGI